MGYMERTKLIRYSDELDGLDSLPGSARLFSLLHSAQTDLGAYPTSYAIGTECCFPGVKAAGA
jgi:hypothetical protein